jgi:hypothetical protein
LLVGRKLVYRYINSKKAAGQPDIKETAFPVDGEPVSDDGNINIAFAEWVNGQFIIEHNGPHGRILEYWTPSPDARQLHLQIQLTTGFSHKPMVISRLFDAQ